MQKYKVGDTFYEKADFFASLDFSNFSSEQAAIRFPCPFVNDRRALLTFSSLTCEGCFQCSKFKSNKCGPGIIFSFSGLRFLLWNIHDRAIDPLCRLMFLKSI